MTFAEKKFYFIGIGGIGMSGVAKVLLAQGKAVFGSDKRRTSIIEELEKKGARIFLEHNPRNIPEDVDVVIISAAIKNGNPELIYAQDKKIRVLKYSQALGYLMKDRIGIAISGTHGKTTTTAMVSYILKCAGLDPAYVIGGNVRQLGGSSFEGTGNYFVAEACEYDRSFLNLCPQYGAIMNIEEDHLDYYTGGLAEIIDAFKAFVALIPREGLLVINGYDRNAIRASTDAHCEVQTVGIELPADWQAANLRENSGCFEFDIKKGSRTLGRFKLIIPGIHNVADAIMAAALSFRAGVDEKMIIKSLSEFRGADRRFQILGEAAGVIFVDDYAHHPTEIQVTLRAARKYFQGRKILCIFQPHQHSRTRFLLKDFARSFGSADEVFIPDIYFVRDSEEEKKTINSLDLAGEIINFGGKARYLPTFEEIKRELLGYVQKNDVVITMGAGDVFEVAYELMEELGRKNPEG